MLLKDITHIQTGLFARPTDFGELVYLQSKHFDEYGQLQDVLHPDLVAEGIAEKHLLKAGDVLFSAKGTKNFAAVFEKHNKAAVASTSFFIIRPTSNKLLSQYLAWFLNSHSIQGLLKSKAKGTAIPSISKQVLGNLEISVPSIEKQQLIIKLNELSRKESNIRNALNSHRDRLIQKQIFNAIN